MYKLANLFLSSIDAESAHNKGLGLLKWAKRLKLTGLVSSCPKPMPTKLFGLTFPNPVGLAAGLDKNGEHIDALFSLGFGSVEIGTVTPRPQAGNPTPRLFRLSEHKAVINRMGFNNAGVDTLVKNVNRARRKNGILGINIGKNKNTPNENAAADYLYCLERVYPIADYITINISSPNTAGLRDLQQADSLYRLLSTLREAQESLLARHRKHTPMLLKISPDISLQDVTSMANVINELSIDGVIATNTTISREGISHHNFSQEQGGLSGKPLMDISTVVLRRMRTRLPESIPTIGVGGILSGADAVAKMAAGASMVQVYTGLIYRGPNLIAECVDAMRRRKEAPSRGPIKLI